MATILELPVLVGRENELLQLEGFLESAFAGKGTTVFVSGEAGSGKTRLSNEFLNLARKKSVTVLVGWCLCNATEPYFPFVEAFDSFFSESDEGGEISASQQFGLKSWLMGTKKAKGDQKIESITPQAWKDQTFAAVAKDLLNLSNNKPLILFIDDIHWADSASLALLHYLSRSIESERILILATFRSEELHTAIEGQPNWLVETLLLMGREDLFVEIKLRDLNTVEVIKIAENMLSGRIHLGLAEKLSIESKGNPLFVVESLRLLHEQGNLVYEGESWSLSIDKLGLPTKVKDIILRRLSSLKSEQRRVLDVASVIGDKFNPELLGAVLDQDSLRVLEVLNGIAHTNSLVCCEENHFRFDHVKSKDVLYEEIFPPLRQGYHSRIAEKIESNAERLNIVPFGDLAYHYAEAGNKEKSIKYALSAGEDALSRFSNSEAIKHFKYVLLALSETQDHSEQKRIALEGLGDGYYGNCLFKDALKTFEQLSETETGIVRLRAFRKAMDASFFDGNLMHLMELTKKKGEYIADDPLESARIHMNLGRFFSNIGKMKEGLQEMELALNLFEEECSFPDIARTLVGVAIIAISLGQIEKALIAALRSIALFEEFGDLRGKMDAYNRAGQVFSACLFYEEASKKYKKAIEIGQKIGDHNRVAESIAFSSLSLEYSGKLEEAVSKCLEAAKYAEKTDSEVTKGIIYSNLARQYSKLGQTIIGEAYFKKLEALPLQVLQNGMTFYPLTKAIVCTAKGQSGEQESYFKESLNFLKVTANLTLEVLIRANYAWVLHKQKRLDEALAQIKESKRIIDDREKRFGDPIVRAVIIAPSKVEVNKEFTIRLDIINIGKKAAFLDSVNGFFSSAFKPANLPDHRLENNNLFALDGKILGAFQIETLKFSLQTSKSGVFQINPKIVYVDCLGGKPQTCICNSLAIVAKNGNVNDESQITRVNKAANSALSEVINVGNQLTQNAGENLPKFEFKNGFSQSAFEYLVYSFIEDYMHRKFSSEKSGWRTLTEIIKGAKISKFSVYGANRRKGRTLLELEGRGLVEMRVFHGERGRGGKIVKARICYEKDPIKHLIEQRVLKNRESNFNLPNS